MSCSAELKNSLTYKDELLTDLKNLLYRAIDDVERLEKVAKDEEKVAKDAEKQLVQLMSQIKSMAEELIEFKAAVQVIIDMVEPPIEGSADKRTLLEKLQAAP